MAIAVRGTPLSGGAPSGGSTFVVTKPTGVVSGDTWFAYLGWNNSGTTVLTTTGVNGPPAGWVQLGLEQLGSDLGIAIYYKICDGTEGTSATFHLNQTDTRGWISWAYSGTSTTTDPVGSSSFTRTTAGANTTTGAVTVPANGWFACIYGSFDTGDSYGTPTGLTNRKTQNNQAVYDSNAIDAGSITATTHSNNASTMYGFGIAIAPAGSTVTTDQTITGVARITATTAQTQSGKARITATTAQTQTGKSRIGLITAQTQAGQARVTATTTRTQSAKARVTATATQTQAGVARIQVTSTHTQTGKANISSPVTPTPQTITGKANIRANTTQTQAGVARIQVTTTQTITGKGRIGLVSTQTLTGKARVGLVTPHTQTGKARIGLVTAQIQSGKGRIQRTDTQTITGVARIGIVTTRTMTGVARVRATTLRTMTGKAAIVPHVTVTQQTITGTASVVVKTISYPNPTTLPLPDVFTGALGQWNSSLGIDLQMGVFYFTYLGGVQSFIGSVQPFHSFIQFAANLSFNGVVNKTSALAKTAFAASLSFTGAITSRTGQDTWFQFFNGAPGRRFSQLGSMQPGINKKMYFGASSAPAAVFRGLQTVKNIAASLNFAGTVAKNSFLSRTKFAANLGPTGALVKAFAPLRAQFAATLQLVGAVNAGLFRQSITDTLYVAKRTWNLILQNRNANTTGTIRFLIYLPKRVWTLILQDKDDS